MHGRFLSLCVAVLACGDETGSSIEPLLDDHLLDVLVDVPDGVDRVEVDLARGGDGASCEGDDFRHRLCRIEAPWLGMPGSVAIRLVIQTEDERYFVDESIADLPALGFRSELVVDARDIENALPTYRWIRKAEPFDRPPVALELRGFDGLPAYELTNLDGSDVIVTGDARTGELYGTLEHWTGTDWDPVALFEMVPCACRCGFKRRPTNDRIPLVPNPGAPNIRGIHGRRWSWLRAWDEDIYRSLGQPVGRYRFVARVHVEHELGARVRLWTRHELTEELSLD